MFYRCALNVKEVREFSENSYSVCIYSVGMVGWSGVVKSMGDE